MERTSTPGVEFLPGRLPRLHSRIGEPDRKQSGSVRWNIAMTAGLSHGTTGRGALVAIRYIRLANFLWGAAGI